MLLSECEASYGSIRAKRSCPWWRIPRQVKVYLRSGSKDQTRGDSDGWANIPWWIRRTHTHRFEFYLDRGRSWRRRRYWLWINKWIINPRYYIWLLCACMYTHWVCFFFILVEVLTRDVADCVDLNLLVTCTNSSYLDRWRWSLRGDDCSIRREEPCASRCHTLYLFK